MSSQRRHFGRHEFTAPRETSISAVSKCEFANAMCKAVCPTCSSVIQCRMRTNRRAQHSNHNMRRHSPAALHKVASCHAAELSAVNDDAEQYAPSLFNTSIKHPALRSTSAASVLPLSPARRAGKVKEVLRGNADLTTRTESALESLQKLTAAHERRGSVRIRPSVRISLDTLAQRARNEIWTIAT